MGPSQRFYDGRLHTGITGLDRLCVDGFDWPNFDAPLAFVPVEGMESRDGVSHANSMEATVVAKIVNEFLSHGLAESNIGVISPYAAQVRSLKRLLGGSRPGSAGLMPGAPGTRRALLEISSVDGFQGREKDVIVISTVRANPSGELGFVKDLRRMNVSLTRAKRGVIVVGNPQTLQ